ncbi:MAG: hypothetical protein FJ149_05530 [Euryarchaeota archaeon]|nr:hypothetical protein [Euryarchaeota archaeon]
MGKIAKEASCSRSTVHGIAMTLQRQGILQRIKGSRHPVLFERGPKANDLEVLKDINRRGRAFGLERGPDAPDGATPNIGPARYRTIASGARCPTGPNPNNQAGLMELETGGRVHTVQLSISLDRPYSWSEVKRAFLSVKDTHLLHDVVRHECTYIGKDGPVRLAIQGPKLVLYMPSIVVRSWGDLQTWFDYSASRIEALKVELKERAGLVLGKVSMPRLHCAFTELGEAYNLLFEKVPVDFRLPSVWMDCSLGPPEIEVGSYKLALTMYLLPALVDDLLTKDAEKAEKIRELEDQLQAMRKKGGAP